MKRLFLGAVVAALCVAPNMSRAESQTAPGKIATPGAPDRDAQARPASDGDSQSAESEASDYAAREKASPELEKFAGGADGVYIGTGALVVALVVVLLLVAL